MYESNSANVAHDMGVIKQTIIKRIAVLNTLPKNVYN